MIIGGNIALAKGNVLNIIVGQGGTQVSGCGGGGGASAVWQSTFFQIIAIAGGGGGVRSAGSDHGVNASPYKYGYSSATSGSSTGATNNNTTYVFNGGTAALGEGGRAGMPSGYGDSGAGWGGDGVIDSVTSIKAFRLNSGTGYPATGGTKTANGGFGGGGSGNGSNGGGGGGGYTGGNGGWYAGGGGSFYDNLTTPTTVVDSSRSYTQSGSPVHGYVTITLN